MTNPLPHDPAEPVSLEKSIGFALDEARMVLPGIQALFGFQLIAVFNQRFDEVLGSVEKGVHLAALLLIGLSCTLVMAPAAYHRQVQRGKVSRHLLELASRLVGSGLACLMLAISADVYVVSFAVTQAVALSAALAAAALAVLGGVWFVFPQLARRRGHR